MCAGALIPRSLPAGKGYIGADVARIQHFEANDLTGLQRVLAYGRYPGLGAGFAGLLGLFPGLGGLLRAVPGWARALGRPE